MSTPSIWQHFLSVFRKSARRFEETRSEKKSTFTFELEVWSDELDGGFVAQVEGFPGAMGQGDTPDEAVHAAVDVLNDVLALRFEEELARHVGPIDRETRHVTLAV